MKMAKWFLVISGIAIFSVASEAVVNIQNVTTTGASNVDTKTMEAAVSRIFSFCAANTATRAAVGMLAPEIKENIIGLAEVRDVFRSPKIGSVAGCMVIEGIVKRNSPIRVLRDNIVIYEGELESLRRFKEDVSEVRAGTECGIGVKNYNDVKAGDQIEVFERISVPKTL